MINFHYSLAVLQMDKSSGFDDIGTPIWKLAGCVFLVYCLLYVSLFKGVKSSGKVVWVTATGKQEKNTRNQFKILNFKQKKGSHFCSKCDLFFVRSLEFCLYFLAAPYMLLSILLIRGLMLPGAMDGIHFYLGKYIKEYQTSKLKPLQIDRILNLRNGFDF